MKNFKTVTRQSYLRSIFADTRAVAALEFALVLPFLLILALGGFELTRYVQAHQRVMHATMTLADTITQSQYLSQTELMSLLGSTATLIAPMDPAGLVATVTSMSYLGPPNIPGPYTMWQRTTGTVGAISIISPPGFPQPDLSAMNGFTFGVRDQVLSVELFYEYKPIVLNAFTDYLFASGTNIYKYAIFRPRFGALMQEPK